MHTDAGCSVDALQFVLVCYRTLAQAPKFSRSTRTSPQWPVEATGERVRTTNSTSGTAGYRRATADRRGAHRTPNTPSTRPFTILLTPYETTRSSAASVS